MTTEIETYEGKLELTAEHVYWKFYNPRFTDDPCFEDIYQMMVQDEIDNFKKKFGQDIYLLGRSGRHVCVDDTSENRERYFEMQSEVESQINGLIARVNEYGKDGNMVFSTDEMIKHNNETAVKLIIDTFGCDEAKAKDVYGKLAAIVVGSLAVAGLIVDTKAANDTVDAEQH